MHKAIDVMVYIREGKRSKMKFLKWLIVTLTVTMGLSLFGTKVNASVIPFISYQAHVQNVGWQGWVSNGQTAGTVGQALRVEAFKMELQANGFSNSSLEYRAHVGGIGWQNWSSDDSVAGTTGQGRQVEAFQVRLKGDIAQYYDIQYRAHVEGTGWQNWVSNGDLAGTTGQGRRIEAFEVKLTQKNNVTPNASPEVQILLNSLNAKRQSLGLNPVSLDANLSARAEARAENAVANGGLPTNHLHTNGEVVGIGWNPRDMINAWYNETNMITNGTPGHRMWVANPRATKVGFGIVGSTIVGISDVGQY